MKIARVEAIPLRLPFTPVGPPIVAFGRQLTGFETVLVRVETDEGIVGHGETPWGMWRPLKALIEDFISPVAVGRDPTDVAAAMHEIQRLVYIIGRYGLTMFALSALDTALWDIAGKAAGVPLHRLFGSAGRPVPAYVSLWVAMKKGKAWEWESTDPEVLADRTRAAVAAGYRHLKLHGTSERDVRTILDAAGSDSRILIDASCRWTPAQAREAALRLKPYNPYWLEEPIFPPEDFGALGRLQAETGVPLAAGENACTAFEFAAMFAARAVSFAQPNVTRVGGVSELRKVIALAETSGVEVCPHSVLFGPGFLATLQVMAAQPRPGMVEKVGVTMEASLYGSALEPVDGHFVAPSGPGLGCDPDPDVIRDCRIAG